MSHPIYFTNHMQVASGARIFRITFAYQEAKSLLEFASVVMDPIQAKRLHAVLGQSIEKFEEQFGHIQDGSIVVPSLQLKKPGPN